MENGARMLSAEEALREINCKLGELLALAHSPLTCSAAANLNNRMGKLEATDNRRRGMSSVVGSILGAFGVVAGVIATLVAGYLFGGRN